MFAFCSRESLLIFTNFPLFPLFTLDEEYSPSIPPRQGGAKGNYVFKTQMTTRLAAIGALAPIFVISGGAKAQSEGELVTTSPIVQESTLPKFDVPADADLAVGGLHVVVVDNYQIHVYTKSTFDPQNDPSWTDEFDLRYASGFFSDLVQAPETFAPFDPRVIYDIADDRYWIVAMDYIPAGGSASQVHFNIAVSEDGDATGTWYKFRLDARAWLGNNIDFAGPLDFPNIAVDDDWLYITAWTVTDFDPELVVESPVWIINKQELMDDEAAPYTTLYERLVTFAPFVFEPYNHRATPAPVVRLNPDEAPLFFLGVDPGNPESVFYPNNDEQSDLTTVWDDIVIHAISVVDGTTVERENFTLNLTGYDANLDYRIPSNATTTQPSNGTPLRVNSARFWSTPVYRDDYIWATHHVRNVDTGDHESRWYRIKMNGWPDSIYDPELEDWGTIAPVPESGNETIFPSVSVNFWWDMLVAYHEVGSTQKLGVRGMLLPWGLSETYDWIKNDDLGLLTAAIGNPGRIRWGDYSGTESDPADWCTYWTYHMWAQDGTTNRWKTWLSRNYMTELCSQEFGPDYSRDGIVDVEDAALFEELYASEDIRADFNRDRTVDSLDFAAFLVGLARGSR